MSTAPKENGSAKKAAAEATSKNGSVSTTKTKQSATKTISSGRHAAYKVPLTTNKNNNNDQLIPQKIGKANPVRDLCIFLGFIGIMFGVSYLYKDVGRNVDDEKNNQKLGAPSIFNIRQYRKKMLQAITQAIENNGIPASETILSEPARTDCTTFLQSSTIPGNSNIGGSIGWSLFAGVEYRQGDVVLDLGAADLEMPNDYDGVEIKVVPLAMLLKHHPYLANVEPTQPLIWSKDSNSNVADHISLRATRHIEAGEELFLDWKDYPVNAMPLQVSQRIPRLENYQEANDIILDERHAFKAFNIKKIQKKRSNEVGMGLRMTKKAVKRYSPVTAALLPTLTDSLVEYNKPRATTAYMALHNKTLDSLHDHGICMTDVFDKLLQRTRTKRDKRITPIPLFITTTQSQQCTMNDDEGVSCQEEETTNNINKNCLYRTDSTMVICPLIHVEYVASSSDNNNNSILVPNAKFQWSHSWNPINGTKLRGDAVIEKYATDLSWEAIALQDVKRGDKVVVALEQDPQTGAFLVPDDLFPEKWRSS